MASKATKKTKASRNSKKLARGKKMNEVKPLATDYYLNLGGIKGEPQN